MSSAAAEVPLSKPVVATFVQRPDFGGLHEQANNRSQTENLVFMELPHLIETDFGSLRNIFPFPEAAHLFLPASYVGASDVFAVAIQALEQAVGVRIELVALGDSVSVATASLPTDIFAAFVARTPQVDRFRSR